MLSIKQFKKYKNKGRNVKLFKIITATLKNYLVDLKQLKNTKQDKFNTNSAKTFKTKLIFTDYSEIDCHKDVDGKINFK